MSFLNGTETGFQNVQYDTIKIPAKPVKEDNPLSPNHYVRYKIQPLDFIAKNNLNFLVGNIIKYVLRHDAKNGVEDLKKARVYLDKLIEEAQENEQKEEQC